VTTPPLLASRVFNKCSHSDYFWNPDTLRVSPGLEVYSVCYRTQGGQISPNKYDSTLLLNVSSTSRQEAKANDERIKV
jgi:hypothetical protein